MHPTNGKISCTPQGRALVRVARKYMQAFVDYGFTAKMEQELDGISKGICDGTELNSMTVNRLVAMTTEAVRETHFKDEAERENPLRAKAIVLTVPPYKPVVKNSPPTALTTGGGGKNTQGATLSDYCYTLRMYWRNRAKADNVKF